MTTVRLGSALIYLYWVLHMAAYGRRQYFVLTSRYASLGDHCPIRSSYPGGFLCKLPAWCWIETVPSKLWWSTRKMECSARWSSHVELEAAESACAYVWISPRH